MIKKLFITLAAISVVGVSALIAYVGDDFINKHLLLFIWIGGTVFVIVVFILIISLVSLHSMGRDVKRWEEGYYDN